MRAADADTLAALNGSRPADTLTVWAWRAGNLVLPDPLQVLDWSASDSAGDDVKVGQQFSLTIADPDGSLGAWRLDDPLGVAGTRLQVIYRVGGAGAINYGWFRIVSNEPTEVTEPRVIDEYGLNPADSGLGPHRRIVYVTTAKVKIEAVDLTADVDRDKLPAPESPPFGASVFSEAARLTRDHFPVVFEPGVTDMPIPQSTIWDRERLEAFQDALARVDARYRMGGDGECRVYSPGSTPVYRIEPGVSLVSVSRKQDIDGLINRWVVEGKDSGDGAPVRAVVTIEDGPLRFDGPHKNATEFYSSEMITTATQAIAYALTLRAKFLASLAVDLSVQTIPRPELQAGDRVEVGCPVPAGHIVYLPGTITSLSRGGSPLPGPTSLTVSCSYADVIDALTKTPWAADIGGPMPVMTWDMMPGSWGDGPASPWNSAN